MREDIANAEKENEKLDEEIRDLEVGREENDERTQALSRMVELKEKVKEVNVELARFAEFDPDEMEKVKEHSKGAREAANRWIDNIFNLQSWANKTFMMEKKDFSEQFGIPEDLDYIE